MRDDRRTTTRKKLTPEDRKAAAQAAAQERQAKNQMVLIGGIGGGVLLLLIIIIAAASSGGSKVTAAPRKAAPPPAPVEAPKEKPKPVNYVRNTGAIVFVCAGTEQHPEKEVLIPLCPKCSAKNQFEVDGEAGGYRCAKCKELTSDIKCVDCGRSPRVTKLKKMLATAQ